VSVDHTSLRLAFSALAARGTIGSDVAVIDAPERVSGLPAVLLGLDPQGRRHVMVPVDAAAKVLPDRRSDGVQIGETRLTEEGVPKRFLDIVCMQPHLDDIFCIVTAEMLEAMAIAPERLDLVASQVLGRWRELLGRRPAPMLTRDAIVGLAGELTFLRALVERSPRALLAWTGPSGAVHDFTTPLHNAEVKATTSRHGWRAEIHGLDQLLAPEGRRLHLAMFRFDEAPTGLSLLQRVDELVALGVDAAALSVMLADAGADAAQLAATQEVRLALRDQRIYAVTPDFPRIVPDSLVARTLPVGVARLNYTIDLTAWPDPPLTQDSIDELVSMIAGES
jgi:hypothetical protein